MRPPDGEICIWGEVCLEDLRQGCELLVAPLAHPRYRRDHRRPRDEPATRSDLLLHSGQWGRQVVGKLSPWLQLDSPHAAIRRRSEAAFRQEIAWAAHLGLAGPECRDAAQVEKVADVLVEGWDGDLEEEGHVA